MTFDKRRNKIEMKRNMEIRDYRMRPADPRAKRVHAVPREGDAEKEKEKEKERERRETNKRIYIYIIYAFTRECNNILLCRTRLLL